MGYRGAKVAVVVPAHNEADFVGGVVRSIPEYVDVIVVVDDASTDGTSAVVTGLSDPRVTLVRLERNAGVGGATVTGYRKALDLGGDVVVKMDGDGQMSADDLPRLLDAVLANGVAYAKGNRFLVGSLRRAMPFFRLVGNVILTFLTKLASGYWHVFDPQNGYTAIRADVLRQLDLDAVHRGYFFENDMLVQLNLFNHKVRDVPMVARYGGEKSGISPMRVGMVFPVLLLSRFVLRIYRKYVLRDFSPIALFLLSGFGLFGWGVTFGVFLLVRSNTTGVPTPTGTIMLAIVPLFLGFQLLLEALVLDIQETPR
jgi:glycosyltransferase involved in cell wall biosynthesis